MLKIILPYPSPGLMPNRKNGRHWGATVSIKNKAFNVAGFLTMAELNKAPHIEYCGAVGKIPLTITFVRKDKRSTDLDNCLAASKSALDGIAEVLRIDDKQFEPITLKRGYDKSTDSYMVVEIG